LSWRPLIESAERRAQIAAVIVEIEAAVGARALAGNDHADFALLRATLGRDELAASCLAAAIREAGRGGPGLFGGLAGTGWTIARLAGGDEADGVCVSIEEALVRLLDRKPASFDLVAGIAGFGMFALERHDTPTGARFATNVLDHLDRLSRPHAGGIAWFTSPDDLTADHRALSPAGYWNLGLAHGAPGVIAVLARFIDAGIEVDRASRLCDGAMAAVLAHARPSSDGDRYPIWHPDADAPSRVAWCYGDLGVAFAILAAARARRRDDWRDHALELVHGVARRARADTRVVDAGLCHGAAGNGHLFNRLYQATGDDEFRVAALTWFDDALALRRPDGIAGFAAAVDHGWEPATDLLNGAVGIALALHAAISDDEPGWDRVLAADVY
jgi:hypothetical protein